MFMRRGTELYPSCLGELERMRPNNTEELWRKGRERTKDQFNQSFLGSRVLRQDRALVTSMLLCPLHGREYGSPSRGLQRDLILGHLTIDHPGVVWIHSCTNSRAQDSFSEKGHCLLLATPHSLNHNNASFINKYRIRLHGLLLGSWQVDPSSTRCNVIKQITTL